MLHGWKSWTIASALVLVGLTAQAQTFQTPAKVEVVPNEYVVKLKPGLTQAFARTRLSGQIVDQISKHNLVVVRTDGTQPMVAAMQSLGQIPGVEYVEPNYIFRINKNSNDPDFAKLWGLHNTGQVIKEREGVAGVDIGALNAWDIHTGSRDMIVAVIDTGVDYSNPDLRDNIWVNQAEENGEKGVDDDKNGYVDDVYGYDFSSNKPNGMDDHGHGSHCSGTIGATGDNNESIVGVNWQVRIMPVKFLDAGGGGTLADAVKAVDYAVANGAKVLSNSWGSSQGPKALEEAIQRSHAAGTLFVAAAGNSGSNNDVSGNFPSNYDVPNVVAVAAIGNRGDLADFSSYGKTKVHVAAPGVDVYSTIVNREFDFWSGTSMATPHVSGVAALLWSHEPNMTNVEVKERLIRTARPLAGLRGKMVSNGVVNAEHALKNTVPPADENDPFVWPQYQVSVSTPHPYEKNKEYTYEVEAPEGTTAFAIHFSKFATERRYDPVSIYDEAGKLIGTMSGKADDSFSPVIPGRKAKLVLKSDETVTGYGFDIDALAIKPAVAQPPTDQPSESPSQPTEPPTQG